MSDVTNFVDIGTGSTTTPEAPKSVPTNNEPSTDTLARNMVVHTIGAYARKLIEEGSDRLESGGQALIVAMMKGLDTELLNRDHLVLWCSTGEKSKSQKEADKAVKLQVGRDIFGFTGEEVEVNGKKRKDSMSQDFQSRVRNAAMVAIVMTDYKRRSNAAKVHYNHNGDDMVHADAITYSVNMTTGAVDKVAVLGVFLGLDPKAPEYNAFCTLIGRGDKLRNFKTLARITKGMLFPSGGAGSAGASESTTRVNGTMKDIAIALGSKVKAMPDNSPAVSADVKAEFRNVRDVLDKFLGDGGESTEIQHINAVKPEDASLGVLVESLRLRLWDDENDAKLTAEDVAAVNQLHSLTSAVVNRIAKMRGTGQPATTRAGKAASARK